MRYKSGLLAIILFSLAFSQFNAHEDHEKKIEKPDTVTVVNGDTIAINGLAVSDSLLATEEAVSNDDEQLESTEEYKLHTGDVLFEHIHNKIVHYPIALALVAFLFAVVGYKDDRYQAVIKLMLLIAGLFAIAAFFSGANQFEHFVGDPKEWLANIHRLLGIGSSISIWLCIYAYQLSR